jgi:hypothetical protein
MDSSNNLFLFLTLYSNFNGFKNYLKDKQSIMATYNINDTKQLVNIIINGSQQTNQGPRFVNKNTRLPGHQSSPLQSPIISHQQQR